jgi:hypothetical protein
MTTPFKPAVNPSQPVRWRGASGRAHDMYLDPIWSVYLPRPGVYIFCREITLGRWSAVYVGETDNFSRRLTDNLALHHRWESVRAAGATHIGSLHVPNDYDGTLRRAIKTDLRHA